MISYNYDCPGKNQIALNWFTLDKSTKLAPGLQTGDLSQGTASLYWGEWFQERNGFRFPQFFDEMILLPFFYTIYSISVLGK